MKYSDFKCPKCGESFNFTLWNKVTRGHMAEKRMPMKAFKSIRECVGKYHRNYVCPGCLKVSSMREIAHE